MQWISLSCSASDPAVVCGTSAVRLQSVRSSALILTLTTWASRQAQNEANTNFISGSYYGSSEPGACLGQFVAAFQ